MKTQTTFDDLVLEFPALEEKQGRALKGGSDTLNWWNGTGWASFSNLPTVVIHSNGSHSVAWGNGTIMGGGVSSSPWGSGGGGYSGGGGGYNGGGSTGGGWVNTYNSLSEAASLAIDHVNAWQEFYVKGQQAFDGNLKTDLRSVINAIAENPYKSFIDTSQLQGEGVFKGLAIIDKVGKVLGVAAAVQSGYNSCYA